MAYTVDNTVTTSLVSGKIYKFKFRAINAIGNSEDSTISRFAMADLPSAPTKPTKDLSKSTKNSVFV